jgi:tripartite-type tricarboxylate transporter receptor subunit TctC
MACFVWHIQRLSKSKETPMTTMSRRWALCAGLSAAAMCTWPALVQAQTAPWPSKAIRFVVPFAPGGTSEIVARSVAAELTKQLGQSVYVENKPGGAGVTAMQDVAKAAPDGHTIILTHVGTLAVNPYMLKSQPYDVNKDFVPVTLLAKVPNVFVIHPDVPAKNFKEFVAYAKANPGQLNYGSAGNASAGHLAMEYLKLVTGMYITHIPYRGTGPQLTDLLAGRTQASSAGMPALGAHIRSGKLRAIAVGTQQRIAAMPDVPTVAELGFKEFETSQWYGIHVPAGTPPDIVKRLQEESLKALKSSAVTERFATDNAVGGGGPSSEYAAFIKNEQRIWSDIVKRAGIKPD